MHQTNNPSLLLFTNSFPYGRGEEFLETELPFLSDSFHRIIIHPRLFDGPQRTFPTNVSVAQDYRLYQERWRQQLKSLWTSQPQRLLSWHEIYSQARYLNVVPGKGLKGRR